MVKSLNGVLRILLLSSLFLAAMASSAQVPENLYNDLHWRINRSAARGTDTRRCRRSEPAECLLRRAGEWRSVEVE